MTRSPPSRPEKPTRKKDEAPRKPTDAKPDESMVDEALDDTFPASDPPAWGGTTGAGAPDETTPHKPSKPKR